MRERVGSGRAARLLAGLAVVVGLLAMHGTVGAHHGPADPPGPAATAREAMPPAVMPPAVMPPAVMTTAVMTTPVDVLAASPALPACSAGCGPMTALCLAVLAAAGLAVAHALRGTAAPRALGPGPLARVRPSTARRARGPDPVRELCISRT